MFNKNGNKDMLKASKSMRFFFFNTSVITVITIWLSGFNNVHWSIYLMPVFFIFAAITGFCPGLIMTKRLFGES